MHNIAREIIRQGHQEGQCCHSSEALSVQLSTHDSQSDNGPNLTSAQTQGQKPIHPHVLCYLEVTVFFSNAYGCWELNDTGKALRIVLLSSDSGDSFLFARFCTYCLSWIMAVFTTTQWGEVALITPIIQMRKLRLIVAKWFTLGCKARTW